jgi:hypothetical protein
MIATVRTQRQESAPSYPANINVRLQLDQLEELQAVADHHGIKLAVVVRMALRKGIQAADRQLAKDIADAEAAGGSPIG